MLIGSGLRFFRLFGASFSCVRARQKATVRSLLPLCVGENILQNVAGLACAVNLHDFNIA